VGLLLLSPTFFDSGFIDSEELPPLLEGAETGSLILIVIPISASNYEPTPLAKYRFAHPPDRPLDKLRKPDRNAAFVEIAKKIHAAAQSVAADITPAPAATIRPLEVPLSQRPGSLPCCMASQASGRIIYGCSEISIA
jgi:hypothetical protein